jgi:hypothetical protein
MCFTIVPRRYCGSKEKKSSPVGFLDKEFIGKGVLKIEKTEPGKALPYAYPQFL